MRRWTENIVAFFAQTSVYRTAGIISLILLVLAGGIVAALVMMSYRLGNLPLLQVDLAAFLNEARYLWPFGVAGSISWAVWGLRWVAARQYRPIVNDFRTTTSVIVPCYREDPDVTVRCLKTWLRDNPTEVIIVVDVDDTEVIERLKEYESDCRVRVIPFKHNGKRSAMGVGIRHARGEILVFADSDTAWEPGLLHAVQMPFVDPRVGGVSTRQNVFMRESSIWRIIADWLINTRYLDYVPIESLVGAVPCISGRTAAYRASVIRPVHHMLEREIFFGRQCIAGDDGRLTWLTLAQGYKTVYQSNARAWSMFPNSLKAFVKQRVRWNRNSYRCYITAMLNGWLWEQPIITQVRVLQILATPITTGLVAAAFVFLALERNLGLIAGVLVWMCVGRAIRSISHLREHPRDIVALPLVILMIFYIGMPIKIWAFISMNKQGWLTRNAQSVGGEGQSEASLQAYGLTPAEGLAARA
jgi:hyaluronan synthase